MMSFSSAGCTTAEINSIMTGPHTSKPFTSTLFQDILLNAVPHTSKQFTSAWIQDILLSTVLYTKVISHLFCHIRTLLCVYLTDKLISWQSQICGLYHLPFLRIFDQIFYKTQIDRLLVLKHHPHLPPYIQPFQYLSGSLTLSLS